MAENVPVSARKENLPVDFTAWKGSMKEPADLDILLSSLAKQRGQKHQVVILDPDEITILKNFFNGFSEKFVDLLIGFPPLFIERDFTRVVMEQGPKNTTKKKRENHTISHE